MLGYTCWGFGVLWVILATLFYMAGQQLRDAPSGLGIIVGLLLVLIGVVVHGLVNVLDRLKAIRYDAISRAMEQQAQTQQLIKLLSPYPPPPPPETPASPPSGGKK